MTANPKAHAERRCRGCHSIQCVDCNPHLAENYNRAVADQLHILATYPRRYPPTAAPLTTEQINHAMAQEQRAEAMAEERAWASDRDADYAASAYYGRA